MASFEPTSPQLFVHDVLAFSDAELVQYMRQHRYSDSGFDLHVEGWDALPKDQREKLAERLRFGALKAGDAMQSHPVDLDQVTARLLEVPSDDALSRVVSAPLRRRERSPTLPPPGIDEFREDERRNYNALVNDGCRACYPISLLEEVSENPKEYRAMLLPWQEFPDSSTPSWHGVFWRQLKRWEDFRRWQLVNREIYDAESGYLAFVEKRKRMWEAKGDTEELAALEADPSYIRWDWNGVERVRERDYPYLWWIERSKPTGAEEGVTEKLAAPDADHYDVFPVYVEKVKRRLAQHGFTRTFQLEEDPMQQDKLTTWIEYLNYEYSWYDRYTRAVKQLQSQHDEAWKKLVNSGVLRPSETEEYLRTTESSSRREGEKNAARKAVESAERAAEATLIETEKARNGRSSLTKQERTRKLAAARSRLIAAKEALKALQRRSELITEFIRGTWPYLGQKGNVHRHSFLLQWILEQVPLIEAELEESEAAKGSSQDIGVDFACHLDQHEPEQRPCATAVSPGSGSNGVSPPSPSPPRQAKDASRKTHSGRIAKSQSGRGTRSRQSAPTCAEALPPDRRRGPSKPDMLKELGDNSQTAPQPRRRQERASRRLAGQLPEFEMRLGRGEMQPLYEASLQQLSNTPKMSSSGPRNGRLSKKPTGVKGAKPQGVLKSRQGGLGHLKRLVK